MQICHTSVKTVTGPICSGTVVPYQQNSYLAKIQGDGKLDNIELALLNNLKTKAKQLPKSLKNLI